MSGASAASPILAELLVADFDYDLPGELIAQTPLERRDASRMLVLERRSGRITHSTVDRLGEWLVPGDLLVANNSRVIPARLRGRKVPSGGTVEVLLLRNDRGSWRALARPAKRLVRGSRLAFASHDGAREIAYAVVEEKLDGGEIRLRFEAGADDRLAELGEAPLPPYITTPLADAERYQTVYAKTPGSAAAPTAGLHFTERLIEELRASGVEWAEVTLHVGLDTFRPVTVSRVEEHHIHREWCEVSDESAATIAACRDRGRKVVALGTTAARTLETLGRAWREGPRRAFRGETDVFIVPGHEWALVDGMLTNFHLPRSTLLMMVSALAGRDTILGAYEEAIKDRYRFYSFGDAMLIV